MNYYLDRDKRMAVVNTVMDLRVPQISDNFFIISEPIWIRRLLR